jgi:RHS repeat-associated protein
VYDAWNRLVQVKNSSNVVIVTYGRDALHRHVTDTVGSTVTDRFFSGDWQLLETKVGSNTVTRNVWSPVYVDGMVLRDRDTDGNGSLDERLYALQDANWNTTALVNAGGTVQERYTYTPFGQVTFRDGSGSTLSGSARDWVFLHQGGERIAAGDYEFRNRVYSPSLGRWLSNDPLGFNAGDQNWYRAIGNNPGNRGDPEGLIATFKEPVLSRIGPNGMSIEPDQPYFAPSGDWMDDYTHWFDNKFGYTGSVISYTVLGGFVGAATVGATALAVPLISGALAGSMIFVGVSTTTAVSVGATVTTVGITTVGTIGTVMVGYEGVQAAQNGDWETVGFLGGAIAGGGFIAGSINGSSFRPFFGQKPAPSKPSWNLGDHKKATKWQKQMEQRDWTPKQIDEALAGGQKHPAPNKVNPGNSATRYVHPKTGRSVVVDDVTGEVLHVGGDGFKH